MPDTYASLLSGRMKIEQMARELMHKHGAIRWEFEMSLRKNPDQRL